MDLMFFINALLRKKWVIVICTIAGVGAALLFTFTKKNLYLSAATYSTGFTMKQQVKMTTDEGLNIFEIDQRFKNVIETFKTPGVIAMVSYDLMLHDLENKRPFTTLTEKEKQKSEFVNINVEKAKQILHQKKDNREILKAYDEEENKVYQLILLYQYDNESILDNLTVDRVEGTDYLNILYKSENPEMSAYVVNTIGQEFISFFNSINTTRTEESATRLDSLANKKKKEIEEKTLALRKFKESFNSPDIADRSKAAFELLKDQQTSLSGSQARINTLQGSLNSVNQKLNNIGNIAENTVTNNSELITLQQKNRDLALALIKKGGTDAAIDAEIQANQKRIAQLQPTNSTNTDKSDLRKTRADLISQKISLENDIIAERNTIATLQGGVKTYSNLANSGAGADVVVSDMQKDIDNLSQQYNAMTNQLQNAQNINIAPEINFKQTLVGQPATKPEHSHRKVIIGVGGFAALIFSSLWIIIMDFLDQSVRAPSVFNKSVNLKLLAIVNKIDLKHKDIDEYFAVDSETRVDKSNTYIENLRKLRYEIENSGKKIILFTSTKQQEGKTTIIEALANSFSLSKKKVLLIDTNFSNNSLTEKFQAKQVLDQFSLNGEANGMEKFAAVNTKTKISNIDIIGCKESALSPDEVLQKNNLLQNLPRISSQYDYVLMEGASLNEHADTKELLKYADAIVVVFSAKSVIRQTDKESIKFLRDNNEKLIGAILNGVERDNIDM